MALAEEDCDRALRELDEFSFTSYDVRARKPEEMFELHKGTTLVAVWQYEGQDQAELNMERGDAILFLERDASGWVASQHALSGAVGWLPERSLAFPYKESDGSSVLLSIALDDLAKAVPPAPTPNTESINLNRAQTADKLKNFLNRRVGRTDLQQRNILSTTQSPTLQAAAKSVEKKKKKEFLSKFFARRGTRPKRPNAALKKNAMNVFGLELETLLQSQHDAGVEGPIPIALKECVEYLEEHLKLKGIFRVSGKFKDVDDLKNLYKSPVSSVSLKDTVTDPNCVAGLLKNFLNSLPEPLFTFDAYEPLIKLCDGELKVDLIREQVLRLPEMHLNIIFYLMTFLKKVASHSDVNMMTPENIGIVFGPGLIRPRVQTQTTMLHTGDSRLIEFMVEHYDELFD